MRKEQPDLPSQRLIREQAAWLAPARSWLLQRANVDQRRSLLDLGCGFGVVSQELARLSRGQVVALDHSLPALLTAAAGLAASPPACADAAHLPFADASFDLVFCQLALLWMPLEPTLAEVRRIMQPGGVLLAIEPDYGGMIEQPAELATRELWIAGLARAGADPLVGRKLPGLLAGHGFDVRVELMNELTPPAPQRFELLRGLPLKRKERRAAKAVERSAKQLGGPWQQVVHLPFMLITAALRETPDQGKRRWFAGRRG
ncbi:MAG: class I SAM-dependent methyltransferase [Anaerolineae bacterium]